jgi:hypothetical protein
MLDIFIIWELIPELSEKHSTTPMSEVRYISPRMAEAYAGKSEKTLLRDLQALKEMELLRMTAEGVLANREVILGFLPDRRNE